MQSALDASLICAYRDTEYRIAQDCDFVLEVGVASKELAGLYKSGKVSCAAFITACNPFSRLSTATNFVRFLTEYFVPQLTGNSLRFSGIQ